MGRTPHYYGRNLHIFENVYLRGRNKSMHPHGGTSQRIIKYDTRLACWSEVSHPSQEKESDAKRENQEDDSLQRFYEVNTIGICCPERKS